MGINYSKSKPSLTTITFFNYLVVVKLSTLVKYFIYKKSN